MLKRAWEAWSQDNMPTATVDELSKAKTEFYLHFYNQLTYDRLDENGNPQGYSIFALKDYANYLVNDWGDKRGELLDKYWEEIQNPLNKKRKDKMTVFGPMEGIPLV